MWSIDGKSIRSTSIGGKTSAQNFISYCNQGRYGEAESLYQQALAMTQRLLGEEHPETIVVWQNLERLWQNHESVAKGDTQ